MGSNFHEDSVAAVLQAVLGDVDDEAMVVTADANVIEQLVSVLGTLDASPSIRLLAPTDPIKSVLEDFMVAGSAADLAAEDRLEIRTAHDRSGTLVLEADRVVSIVAGSDTVAGLVSDDEAFVTAAAERYDRRWADADPYQLRTPPLSQIRATLEADIGPETADDFDAVLASLETVRGEHGLDEVTISLLVAAKNRELLYDISKWGEDVGIASKATFSRTKTKLEDMGLIDTEKVPIDVGRPRLRLLLGDDRLRDADSGQLASVAQSMLGS